MDVILTDTFAKSLRKLIVHSRWYWKAIDLFRYDIPRFSKNVWFFRRELWNNYSFDSHGSLLLLRRHLQRIADYIEKYGLEVDESRLKKVAKMRRAIEILTYHIDENFIDMAEQQLGKTVVCNWDFEEDEKNPSLHKLKPKETEQETLDNREIFELARQIERDTWKELFTILKGQDYEKDSKLEFDGSGLLTWWD